MSLHSSSLKGVRPDIDGESEGGAGLVVALVADQRVHRHHLQVQRVLSGPRDGTGQDQHGTDVIDLPDVKVSVIITRANAEGVISPRRDAGGLDLEDVRGDGALRGDAHVAVDDGERQISTGRLVDGTYTAVLGDLYVGVLAAVVVHTLVSSVDIHTGLRLCALVFTGFTFVYVLAHSGAQQLVSFWAHTGELPWFVDTLELAQVAGVAALIDVVTSEAVGPELVALITATKEGAISVVAPLRAGGTHLTFIHINAGSVVSCQLEARFTLTGEGTRDVDTAMLAVPVPALIDVNALGANLAVTVRTLAGEGSQRVDALLAGLAVVFVSLTLINIHTAVCLRLVAHGAGVEGLGGRDGGLWSRDD